MRKPFYRPEDRRAVVSWSLVAAAVLAAAAVQALDLSGARAPNHRTPVSGRLSGAQPVLGKVRVDGDRQYLWAKGAPTSDAAAVEWFDLTGSPLPPERFDHGIGRDTIPSIDYPVFVKPDDPALRARWGRSADANIDGLRVIGFARAGEARAYPVRLLNHHELVNDPDHRETAHRHAR